MTRIIAPQTPRLHGRGSRVKSRFSYHCVTCNAVCYTNHQALQRSQERLDERGNVVMTADKDGKLVPATIKIKGTGLGSWSCPVHGRVKVVRKRAGDWNGEVLA